MLLWVNLERVFVPGFNFFKNKGVSVFKSLNVLGAAPKAGFPKKVFLAFVLIVPAFSTTNHKSVLIYE
jgi:hypothetical protein